MMSSQCTHGIPPMYPWYLPTWIMISLWCTEHPPMYWTHIIQGESIQILILKPNANEQVILSTLTFVTGFLQGCLFWKRTVEFNPLIDFYPYQNFGKLCMQVLVFINNMWINPKSMRQYNTVFPNAKKTNQKFMVIFQYNQWDSMRIEQIPDAIWYQLRRFPYMLQSRETHFNSKEHD